MTARETRDALNVVATKLERQANRNTLGHGEAVCLFCDGHGHGDIEHNDGCPIGDLWGIINEMETLPIAPNG